MRTLDAPRFCCEVPLRVAGVSSAGSVTRCVHDRAGWVGWGGGGGSELASVKALVLRGVTDTLLERAH